MVHYRRHVIRLSHTAALSEALARIFEALDAAGLGGPPVRVFLEDVSSGPAAS